MKIAAYSILTYSLGDFLTHHDDVCKKKGQMDNTMEKLVNANS
jgi:hypothetical protein